MMFPLIMMILHLATAAVLWFGGQRVNAGQMEVGSLTAFMQYLLQILVAVMMGVFMVMMIPRAAVSAERLEDLLETEPSLSVPAGTELSRAHAVEFKNVSFGYPGAERPVLNNVSFTAQAGATTAIVGSTGAGKTTLMNLVPRLFDPQQGSVLIGGTEVSELSRQQLATLVGLVPQKPYLFSGTAASASASASACALPGRSGPDPGYSSLTIRFRRWMSPQINACAIPCTTLPKGPQ